MVERAGVVEIEIRGNDDHFDRSIRKAETQSRRFNTTAQRGFKGTEASIGRLTQRTRQASGAFNELDSSTAVLTRSRSGAVAGGLTGSIAAAVTAEAAFDRLKITLAGLAGLVVGGGIALGLAGIAASAKEAAHEFDALAKQADTVGINTEFYQTLQFAAEEAGVAQGLLNSSLIAFAKRVGEARAGTGPLASTLKKLNNELFISLQQSNSQEQAFRILAEAMQSTDSATEKAALASAAFSRAGVELTRVLGGGNEALDAAAKKARDLGIIIDERLLRSAEELSNDMGVAARQIDLNLKQAFIDLAPFITDVTKLVGALAKEIRLFWESFRDVGNRSSFALQQNLADNVAAIKRLDESLDTDLLGRVPRLGERFLKRRNELLKEQKELIGALLAAGTTTLGGTPAGDGDAPGQSDAERQQALADRSSALQALQSLELRFLQSTNQTSEFLRAQNAADLQQFQELLDKKIISQKEFEVARLQLAEITNEELKRLRDEELAIFRDIGDSISSNLESAFRSFVETGKLDFKDLTNSILQDLAVITFRIGVLQPLLGGGGPGFGLGGQGGIFGSIIQSLVAHNGGMVGSSGAKRNVPSALFLGAPRFHNGLPGILGANEFPAILERGETVIPRGGKRGDGVTIQIINNSNASIQEERGTGSNGEEIRRLVISENNKAISRGQMDGSLRQRFGNSPVGVRR